MSSLDKNLAAVSSETRLVFIGLKLCGSILIRVQIGLCIAAFVPNEKMICATMIYEI